MARNVVTQVDSGDFFVQMQDAVSAVLLAPTASTATRYVSADIPNRLHRGATLYWTIASLSTAVSLAVNVNGKDLVTGNYFQIARCSLDGSSLSAGAQQQAIEVYPGLTPNNSPGSQPLQESAILPAVLQVVVSAQTAPGTFSFTMGMSRHV